MINWKHPNYSETELYVNSFRNWRALHFITNIDVSGKNELIDRFVFTTYVLQSFSWKNISGGFQWNINEARFIIKFYLYLYKKCVFLPLLLQVKGKQYAVAYSIMPPYSITISAMKHEILQGIFAATFKREIYFTLVSLCTIKGEATLNIFLCIFIMIGILKKYLHRLEVDLDNSGSYGRFCLGSAALGTEC